MLMDFLFLIPSLLMLSVFLPEPYLVSSAQEVAGRGPEEERRRHHDGSFQWHGEVTERNIFSSLRERKKS